MLSVKSRYGEERTFILVNDIEMKIECCNTLYYSISINGDKEIGIDPDGGPNIYVGKIVEINENKYKITEIISHKRSKSGKLLVRVLYKKEDVGI
jgi:hypothetical protein